MTAWHPKVLIGLLIPIYLIYLFSPAVSFSHDDGVYLVTSRALAAGHGYVIDSLPKVIPQTKYPILYPAILAIIWKLVGSLTYVVFAAKILSVGCTVAWLTMFRRWAIKMLPSPVYVDWVLLFVASSPLLISLSASVLPETLFSLVSLSCVLMLLGKNNDEENLTTRTIVFAAVLATATFLMRTTGIALIAAASIALWRKNPKHSLLFLSVCALLCSPWLYWQAITPAPTEIISSYYSKANYAGGHIFAGYSLAQMATVAFTNLLLVPYALIGLLRLPFVFIGFLLSLLFTVFLALGWIHAFKLRFSVLPIWIFLYFGLLMCWTWPPHRYLVPVAPVLLVYVCYSLLRISWSPKLLVVGKYALTVCGCMAVGVAAACAVKTFEVGAPVVEWAEGERSQEFLEMAQWIQSNTGEDAVISSSQDPLIYLYSGRKAIRLFKSAQFDLFYENEAVANPVGTAQEVRMQLKENRVTHIVLSPMGGFREGQFFPKVFAALQLKVPGAIHLLKQQTRAGYAIYGVNQSLL